MRTNLMVILFSLLLTSILGAEVFAGGIKEEEKKIDTLTVEELAKNPQVYKGEVEIVGLVSKVYSKFYVFRVISLKEFEACGIICEDEPSVPVSYKGNLPKLKDKVWVKGVLKKIKKKGFILEAKEVKIN